MLRPVSRTGLFHCKRQLGVSPITRSLSSLVPSRPCSPLNISTKLRQLRQFTSSAAPNSDRLTWDEFLRVRRQRRLTGLLAAVPSSAFGIYLGFQYFGSGEIDPTKTIFGLDPFLVNSALVLGCGLLGWLAGPTVGKGFWYVFDRKQVQLFSQRESQFLKHIEKNWADPSYQSYSNPVPDYYGEKITSVKDYRRWLKDQKAYRKKARTFL